jgi:tol-pal system protein YbgF
MIRTRATVALAIALALPASAAAANKEHQQIMAELRMLQEQQQQLHQMLGSLGDALKTLTTKLDDQGSLTRKAFADQRLLIEGVGDTVRILREKADETHVRLSTITQELDAVKHAISSAPQPPATSVPGEGPSTGSTGSTTTGAPPATGGTPLVSPQKMYDNAFADYTAGQYDIAILGFETFIKTAPRSELADDAQLNIGNALYAAGKFTEAVAALRQVISAYPQSNSVPAAWYKLGLSYQQTKQEDFARKAFETAMKDYPDTVEANLAKQALERLNKK